MKLKKAMLSYLSAGILALGLLGCGGSTPDSSADQANVAGGGYYGSGR